MPKPVLAIDGGIPVRKTILPYGRQSVGEDDIAAVTEVLRSDWLTTGPKVAEFEKAFAEFTGAKEAVAVNNGTAALHTAMYAVGVTPGDPTSSASGGLRGASEVIVPTMTFAATANAVVFQGGVPVFCDADPETLLIDVEQVEEKITKRTKAVVAVDYAGQACSYDELRSLCEKHHIAFVSDACHALGGTYKTQPIGSLADLSTFSFHPVKPLTTGEGGMITTDNAEYAMRMRRFRNHGLTSDHRERHEQGSWFYEMTDLGYNERLTDFQCALGLSQLKKVPAWTKRRQKIAKRYDVAFHELPLDPLLVRNDVSHAYHLYVIRLQLKELSVDRTQIFKALRAEGLGVNVHYIPVHMHPFYRERFGTKKGDFPVAESAYESILSLPLFSVMTDRDVQDVIEAVTKVLTAYRR